MRSIETMALDGLVFEKIAFTHFGNRRTNKRTNGWTSPLRKAALAVMSGGFYNGVTLKSELRVVQGHGK